MTKTKKKYRKIKIILSILIAATIFFSLFPIDITTRAETITTQLEDKFDGTIEIKRVLLYPLPYPRIVLEDFKVTNEKDDFLSTKKIKINLDLFPLITKKVVIKKLTFIEADIIITIDKAGQLKLKGQRTSKTNNPNIKLPPIYVQNSSITVIDEISQDGFTYSMFGIEAKMIPTGDNIKFKVAGYGTNEGLIELDGLSSKNKNEGTTIDGNINAQHIDLEPFKKYFDFKNKFSAKEGLLSLRSTYSLTTNHSGTNGNINGQITYINLRASIPGAITNDFVSTSGSLDILLDWKNKKVNMTLDKIIANMDGFLLNGVVKTGLHDGHKNRGLTLQLASTAMPAVFAEDIKDTIKVGPGLKKWIDAMSLTGGQIEFKNFDFYKDFENKETKTMLELEFQDSTFNYKRMEDEFTDVWGSLIIKSEKDIENTITIKNFSGISKNSSFMLDGKLRNFRTEPFLEIDGDINFGSNLMEPLANKFNFDLPVITDTIKVIGTLKGPIGSLVLETQADLKDTDFIYKNLFNKPKGFPLSIKTLITEDDKTFHFKTGLMTFGDSSLNFNGLIETNPHKLKLAIKSDDASIKDIGGITSYVTYAEDAKGRVSIDIFAEKKNNNPTTEYNGKIVATGLNFSTPMLESPISKASGFLRLEGNSGTLVLENGTIGKSKFSGKVDIINLSTGRITFNAISPYMNIADMTPTGSGIKTEPFFTGYGTVSVKEGHGLGLSFQNFSTDITMTKDELSFPINNMQSNDGFLNGTFSYFRSYLNKTMFRTNIKAININIESTLKEFGMKKDIHTGKMELELCLSAKKGMENFTEGLNGILELDAKDGHLEQLVAISKVMAVFSPLAYDELFKSGFQYDKMDGRFRIEDGVFRTKDLHIISSALRLSGVGRINTNNGTIKMTIAAHPFTTVDLIRKLPFGTIILGDGFMSIYYKATGRVLDPDIKTLEGKSVENFTVGIFKRLYTVPRDAIRGKEKLECHWNH